MAIAMASQVFFRKRGFFIKMKKTISIISASILALTILSTGYKCQAQEDYIDFSATGGNVVDGFINATNTGFQVTGSISDSQDFGYAKLEIGTARQDILTSGNFMFSQSGLLVEDLLVWFPEGANTISLFIYDHLGNLIENINTEVVADYTLDNLLLNIAYDASAETANGFLKVGDSLDLMLVSQEQILILTNKINEREIYWTETETEEDLTGSVYRYTSHLEISEGDIDILLPYDIKIEYQDLSGNIKESIGELDRAIDANSPIVKIQSVKEGQIFNKSDIEIIFDTSETLASYEIYLDSVKRDISNGGTLKGIKDGSHDLEIIATDIAGNRSEVLINFEVDTKMPEINVTSQLNSSYSQGSEIVLEGKAEPGSKIVAEVRSNVQYFETLADSNGYWRLTINTSVLGNGLHELYIKVIDQAGNVSRILLGVFELIEPVKAVQPVEADQEAEPVKIARAEDKIASDVSPTVYSRVYPEEKEVVVQPRIISSNDERAIGVNWSAWLILVGLIAISFLVAGVSYYGYSQVTTAVSRQKIGTKTTSQKTEDVARELKGTQKHIRESEPEAEDEDDDIEVRW